MMNADLRSVLTQIKSTRMVNSEHLCSKCRISPKTFDVCVRPYVNYVTVNVGGLKIRQYVLNDEGKKMTENA